MFATPWWMWIGHSTDSSSASTSVTITITTCRRTFSHQATGAALLRARSRHSLRPGADAATALRLSVARLITRHQHSVSDDAVVAKQTATAMATFTEIVELLMTPSLPVIIFGIIIIIGAPIILHLILSSSSTYTVPPSVLLLGPDNGGKTALLTLFERETKPSETHTSQVTQSVELNASTDSNTKSSFRNHEDATGTHTKFLLIDTPGHGKLRNVAMGKLGRTDKLKAVVFLVDAAALGEPEALAPTAGYLYDVLLVLQKKASAKDKPSSAVPLLIAANKMDLFTALPAAMVKTHLEVELTRIRSSRSKGLLDSGVGIDDVGSEEQDGWLGEYGSEKFTFQQMREFDIEVDVLPGSVIADEPGADKWWWWIAQRV